MVSRNARCVGVEHMERGEHACSVRLGVEVWYLNAMVVGVDDASVVSTVIACSVTDRGLSSWYR